MSRNILISARDWMQESSVTLSGGAWSAAAPLTNLLDMRPQFVAEAAGRKWSQTTFSVDLGYDRRIGLFHFQGLRASANGRMQLVASRNADLSSPTYDSGVVSSWPQDSDAFGFNPWGGATLNGIYNRDEYVAIGMPRYFIPSGVIVARYIQVKVKDRTASSKLRIGYFGACEVWAPPRNFAFGWSIAALDESTVTRVPFGSSYVTIRGKRRRLDLGLNFQPADEIWLRGIGVAARKGKSTPLAVVPFPDQGGLVEKSAVWGLVSTDSQIANPYYALYSYPLQIEQLI